MDDLAKLYDNLEQQTLVSGTTLEQRALDIISNDENEKIAFARGVQYANLKRPNSDVTPNHHTLILGCGTDGRRSNYRCKPEDGNHDLMYYAQWHRLLPAGNTTFPNHPADVYAQGYLPTDACFTVCNTEEVFPHICTEYPSTTTTNFAAQHPKVFDCVYWDHAGVLVDETHPANQHADELVAWALSILKPGGLLLLFARPLYLKYNKGDTSKSGTWTNLDVSKKSQLEREYVDSVVEENRYAPNVQESVKLVGSVFTSSGNKKLPTDPTEAGDVVQIVGLAIKKRDLIQT